MVLATKPRWEFLEHIKEIFHKAKAASPEQYDYSLCGIVNALANIDHSPRVVSLAPKLRRAYLSSSPNVFRQTLEYRLADQIVNNITQNERSILWSK